MKKTLHPLQRNYLIAIFNEFQRLTNGISLTGDVSKVIKDNGYEDTDADWLNGLLKLKKFTHFDRNREYRKIDINNLKFYHINKKQLIYTVVVTGDDDVDIVWEVNDKPHKTGYALRETINNLLSRDWVIVKTE